jgi:hypothetical protein
MIWIWTLELQPSALCNAEVQHAPLIDFLQGVEAVDAVLDATPTTPTTFIARRNLSTTRSDKAVFTSLHNRERITFEQNRNVDHYHGQLHPPHPTTLRGIQGYSVLERPFSSQQRRHARIPPLWTLRLWLISYLLLVHSTRPP